MEHITIISTYSEGGILKYILYTNKHKELKKADFENHKINANNINFNSIKKQISAIEFELEHNIKNN